MAKEYPGWGRAAAPGAHIMVDGRPEPAEKEPMLEILKGKRRDAEREIAKILDSLTADANSLGMAVGGVSAMIVDHRDYSTGEPRTDLQVVLGVTIDIGLV